MKRKVIFKKFLNLSLLIFIAFSTHAYSAEAPKSKVKLEKEAELIVIAKVNKSKSEDRKKQSGFGDSVLYRYFDLNLTVEKSIKGSLKKGEELNCKAVKAIKGFPVIWWAGNRIVPEKDKRYQIHLKKHKDGEYWILTPNGCKEQ